MTNTIVLPNRIEIKKKGDAALIETLGVAGFARYIELLDQGGEGDYTKDKETMPTSDYSIDEICKLNT